MRIPMVQMVLSGLLPAIFHSHLFLSPFCIVWAAIFQFLDFFGCLLYILCMWLLCVYTVIFFFLLDITNMDWLAWVLNACLFLFLFFFALDEITFVYCPLWDLYYAFYDTQVEICWRVILRSYIWNVSSALKVPETWVSDNDFQMVSIWETDWHRDVFIVIKTKLFAKDTLS